jgi:hypothetical protein
MTKLSSLIQEIRKKRRAENPSQLTDGELVMELAGLLSDDPDDRQVIACGIAVNTRSGSDAGGALQLIREIGISEFTSEQLATMRRHDAFRELQELLRICRGDPDDPMSSENFERIRDLTIAAGSVLERASLHRGT